LSGSGDRPKRGEIWKVNFDPTIGAEMCKERPALIISSDAVGILPLKLVAPITGWDERYKKNVWHIEIDPDDANNLHKKSVVDVLQIRCIDMRRFIEKKGRVSADLMAEIAAAIAAVIEYE